MKTAQSTNRIISLERFFSQNSPQRNSPYKLFKFR